MDWLIVESQALCQSSATPIVLNTEVKLFSKYSNLCEKHT